MFCRCRHIPLDEKQGAERPMVIGRGVTLCATHPLLQLAQPTFWITRLSRLVFHLLLLKNSSFYWNLKRYGTGNSLIKVTGPQMLNNDSYVSAWSMSEGIESSLRAFDTALYLHILLFATICHRYEIYIQLVRYFFSSRFSSQFAVSTVVLFLVSLYFFMNIVIFLYLHIHRHQLFFSLIFCVFLMKQYLAMAPCAELQ